MENSVKSLSEVPIQCTKTPTPIHHRKSSNELLKPVTPDHLKLPKPFKYPERYTSPTDMMMSPVTKGLLARNKKGAAKLPPAIGAAKYHPKVPEMCLQDASTFQNKLPTMIDDKINST